MFRVVAAAALLTGCSVTVGALGEARLGRGSDSTAFGMRVDWHTRQLSDSGEGLTLGARLDHLAQVDPGVAYDASRWEGLLGWSTVPRGYRRTVGFDVLARLGAARGSLGGVLPVPIALSTGLAFSVPMRLNETRYGDDEVLRWTLMLVPFVDVGFLWSRENGPQAQFDAGVGLRLHFDSALLP